MNRRLKKVAVPAKEIGRSLCVLDGPVMVCMRFVGVAPIAFCREVFDTYCGISSSCLSLCHFISWGRLPQRVSTKDVDLSLVCIALRVVPSS